MKQTDTDTWVDRYIARGWVPLPIAHKEKRPVASIGDWTKVNRQTMPSYRDAFDGAGVGLALGETSDGLVDVDLDTADAVFVAEGVLTNTLRSGRASAPDSHYWYQCVANVPENRRYKDPVSGEMLVELRSTGSQTVVEPSIHPSGEPYRWANWDQGVEQVDGHTLTRFVTLIAATVVLGRMWGRIAGNGVRHTAAGALSGYLVRRNPEFWSDSRLDGFIATICNIGSDHEIADRRRIVADTYRAHTMGAEVTGWPTLEKCVPVAERAALEVVKHWLDEVAPDAEDEVEEESKHWLVPTDLAEIVQNGVPPTDWLIDGLLIRGKFHILAADAGSGKTFLSLWMARQIIRNGGRVMMVDEENDPVDIARRCVSLGMTLPEIRMLDYYNAPAMSLTDKSHVRDVKEAAKGSDLLIIDSLWDLLSILGYDPVNYEEVGVAMKALEGLKRGGQTILLIDHVAKKNAKDLLGAGVKKAACHVAFTMHVNTPWDQWGGGNGELFRVKARGGDIPQTTPFVVNVDPAAERLDFLWPSS